MKTVDRRPEDRQRTLLRPQKKDLDGDALVRACGRPLARLIWETAAWKWEDYKDGWKVGDFNFLILESTVASDAIVYAQIWSEPMETVAFEVSSGESNPGAKRFIGDAARKRLKSMGFAIGGGARNFGKELTIGSPADAEVLAGEMLRIFSDVFGYKGRTPLTVRVVRDQRAGRAVVHESLTPEDLQKVLQHMGYVVTIESDAARPFLVVRNGNVGFGIRCDGQLPESSLYTAFDFFFRFGKVTTGQIEQLGRLTARYRVLKGFVDQDGDLMFQGWFITGGGVTTEAIEAFVATWDNSIRHVARRLAKAPGKRAARGAKGRTLVH